MVSTTKKVRTRVLDEEAEMLGGMAVAKSGTVVVASAGTGRESREATASMAGGRVSRAVTAIGVPKSRHGAAPKTRSCRWNTISSSDVCWARSATGQLSATKRNPTPHQKTMRCRRVASGPGTRVASWYQASRPRQSTMVATWIEGAPQEKDTLYCRGNGG